MHTKHVFWVFFYMKTFATCLASISVYTFLIRVRYTAVVFLSPFGFETMHGYRIVNALKYSGVCEAVAVHFNVVTHFDDNEFFPIEKFYSFWKTEH